MYLQKLHCTEHAELIFLQHSDMNDEMKTEAMELCVTACEKFASNNEVIIFPVYMISINFGC